MSSENFVSIIQSRLSELESQRAQVQERLQAEMSKSLMPLNAAIAELRLLLSKVNGDGTQRPPAPNYVGAGPMAAPAPSPSVSKDVVLSPKSKTPVSTNAAVLRMALRGK